MLKQGFIGIMMTSFACQTAVATQSKYEHEEAKIPAKPSAPPPLTQRTPREIPHCERYFLFRGKQLECDSDLARDAGRLRVIMKDVPSALNELDIYQKNRMKIKYAAYVGTAGLLATILGLVLSRPPVDQVSGALRPGGFVAVGGAVLTINSIIYGLSVVKTNEAHIGNAVQNYNSAFPNDPIELQFSTRVNF